jgi:hypothetical protein
MPTSCSEAATAQQILLHQHQLHQHQYEALNKRFSADDCVMLLSLSTFLHKERAPLMRPGPSPRPQPHSTRCHPSGCRLPRTHSPALCAQAPRTPAGALLRHCEILPCPLGESIPERLVGCDDGSRRLQQLNTQLQQLDAQTLACTAQLTRTAAHKQHGMWSWCKLGPSQPTTVLYCTVSKVSGTGGCHSTTPLRQARVNTAAGSVLC